MKSYERLGTRCSVPPLPKKAPSYAKSILDNSFAVTGPKLWNTLPHSVNCAQFFKSLLTSHIMSTYPDQPPLPVHTTPNSIRVGRGIPRYQSKGGLKQRWSTTDGLVGFLIKTYSGVVVHSLPPVQEVLSWNSGLTTSGLTFARVAKSMDGWNGYVIPAWHSHSSANPTVHLAEFMSNHICIWGING